MGKHTKLSAPKPAENENNLDLAERVGRKALSCLETSIDEGDGSPQTAREVGSMMRALTTVEAERRAQSKAKEHTAKSLPRELLFEALRLMTSEERAHVRRELDAMDNTESVLG